MTTLVSSKDGELGVGHLDVLRSLGHVYIQHKQVTKAQTLFAGLQVLLPGDKEVMAALAYANMQGGYYEHALGQARSLIDEDNATLPVVHLLCARALLGLERFDEARQHMQEYANARMTLDA